MTQAAHHNVESSAPVKHFDDIPNLASDAVQYFTPAQNPPAGTAVSQNPPKVFQPLTIKSLKMQNRIILSPLCQYSAEDGHQTDWHFAHLGGIISRGPGLAFIEATSVTPEGRITPEDCGLWKDSQIAPLKRIVDFAHSQGQKIGIQVGHAGRKASTIAPWLSGGSTASEKVNGWPKNVFAPSAISYDDTFPDARAYTLEEIEALKTAFGDAIKRAVKAGFDTIELHCAHGYLLHEFMSPITNKRTDKYGGSFEGRTRLPTELAHLARDILPKDTPLFMRISATDWLEKTHPDEESWTVNDSIKFAKSLVGVVDALDVSTGGNHPDMKVDKTEWANGGPEQAAYQAPAALDIKKEIGDDMLVGVVGNVKDGHIAQALLDRGLDFVSCGRWFQKNPGLVFAIADDLKVDVRMPNQAQWAFSGRHNRKSKD